MKEAHGLRLALCLILLLTIAGAGAAQIQFNRPKTGERLPNPMIIQSPRDEVITAIKQMFETREIALDKEECNPNSGECTLISKPVVFVRGIASKSQLEHYTNVATAFAHNWIRGRYVLRIQVTPATPSSVQVGVYARFEGQRQDVGEAEWVPLTSKGELEDGLLRCLQDRLLGGECKEEEILR